MSDKTDVPTTLAIQGQEVAILEYRGQRVVTFAMIDRLHQRPDGTARKRFIENKDRFVSGADFHLVDYSQKSGYLMLVKSFTDDMAWAVQRELVNCYFRVKQESSVKPATNIPSLSRIRSNFRALVGLHRDYGLDKNMAMLAAEKVMIREFGVEIGRFLELPGKSEGQTHLAIPYPVQERYFNPAEIGARLEPVQSAIRVNRMLRELGLQVDAIVGGHKTWALTADGEEHGRHSGGAPIQQIRWREKVVAVLQAALRDKEMSHDRE